MNNADEKFDIQILSLKARRVVIDVMERNQIKHYPGRWREIPTADHIQHAIDHLSNLSHPAIEDLEHALVRITMAIAQVENL